jgi:hypothetical protein
MVGGRWNRVVRGDPPLRAAENDTGSGPMQAIFHGFFLVHPGLAGREADNGAF